MMINLWVLLTFSPLFLCSLLAFTLIFERAVVLNKLSGLKPSERQSLLEDIAASRLDGAWAKVKQWQPFYFPVLLKLEQCDGVNKTIRDDVAATAMIPIAERLQARMAGLVTVAALAPMFGLLGTVVGLMRAFREIGLQKGPVEPSIVADGLWQALSTTAVGLIIAAICIVCHALFASKIRRSLSEAGQILNSFSIAMETSTGEVELDAEAERAGAENND